MLRELEFQKYYLNGEPIETIYFGGGTPSLLSVQDLNFFFECIYKNYAVTSSLCEITLEANPDDLTPEKILEFRQTPINRFSIGIQSFSDNDLKFMNRAHNATEALQCIQNVQNAGFENLTIDLIYGAPTTSDEQWEANLEQVFRLKIPHLSCYCLTIEEKTALAHFVKTGKERPIDEEQAARQFEVLTQKTAAAGFEHYEISNFALPGRYSRHNTSYWQGKKYLGIGPSAHSFNGNSRQWNIANNAQYARSLQAEKIPFEEEILTPEQHYNEYVMISLRTMWGCDLNKMEAMGYGLHFLNSITPFISNKTIEKNGDIYKLTSKGKFFADGIAAALFAGE